MPDPNGQVVLRICSAQRSRAMTGSEQALGLVGAVDGQGVVRDEVGEGVGDPVEERIQALFREDVVEHLREAAVGVQDVLRARLPGRAGVFRGHLTHLRWRIGYTPFEGIPHPGYSPLWLCPCGVRAVPPVRSEPVMGTVVVGVDGSEESVAALRVAAEEAGRRGASLKVVHAWVMPVFESVPDPFLVEWSGTCRPRPRRHDGGVPAGCRSRARRRALTGG